MALKPSPGAEPCGSATLPTSWSREGFHSQCLQRGQNAEAHATRVGAGQMPSLRADRPSWPTPAEPRVEGGPRLDCRAPVHSHHSSAHPSTTQFLPTPPLPASMCTLRHTRSPHEHSPSSSEAGNLAKPSLPRGERGKLHHARGLASSPPSFPSLPQHPELLAGWQLWKGAPSGTAG